jgi:uncharacterized damage-inducible protein DinB
MNKAGIISELKRALALTIPFFEAEPAFHQKTYAPGKWNVRQILAHLTDSDVVHHYRLRMILSEPGCSIIAFDENKWAKTLAYAQRDMLLMRRTFTTTRESIIELIDLLPEQIFGRSATHSELGEFRAWDVVTKAATHNMHHYGQLVAIREGTPWTPPGAPAE